MIFKVFDPADNKSQNAQKTSPERYVYKFFCMAFYAKIQNRKNPPRRIYTRNSGVFENSVFSRNGPPS